MLTPRRTGFPSSKPDAVLRRYDSMKWAQTAVLLPVRMDERETDTSWIIYMQCYCFRCCTPSPRLTIWGQQRCRRNNCATTWVLVKGTIMFIPLPPKVKWLSSLPSVRNGLIHLRQSFQWWRNKKKLKQCASTQAGFMRAISSFCVSPSIILESRLAGVSILFKQVIT